VNKNRGKTLNTALGKTSVLPTMQQSTRMPTRHSNMDLLLQQNYSHVLPLQFYHSIMFNSW